MCGSTAVAEGSSRLADLDYPGLEKVKAAYDRQQWDEAAKALLGYYRNVWHRHQIFDMQNIKISKEEQKWRMMPWNIRFLCIKAISFL